jgi:hypothetical protein
MFCTAALIMWIPYQPSVLAPLDLHAGELDLDGFGEPPAVDLVVAHEGGRFEWLLSFEPRTVQASLPSREELFADPGLDSPGILR